MSDTYGYFPESNLLRHLQMLNLQGIMVRPLLFILIISCRVRVKTRFNMNKFYLCCLTRKQSYFRIISYSSLNMLLKLLTCLCILHRNLAFLSTMVVKFKPLWNMVFLLLTVSIRLFYVVILKVN